MMLIRENMMGLTYTLHVENKTQTQINFKKKHIIVNMPIEEVSQCWYNWQMKGQKIQEAFSKLSNAEREFIMTGITSDEWDEIFKEKEE
jgi:hypothetical protein